MIINGIDLSKITPERDDVCPAHNVIYGEGDICGVCEARGDFLIQHAIEVHHSTNDHFLKYHLGKEFGIRNNHNRLKLKHIVDHAWGAGLPRAQAEIDCMMLGFSLCVVMPYITQRWLTLDIGYAQFERECEAHDVASDLPKSF